jgi:hypothetical protein
MVFFQVHAEPGFGFSEKIHHIAPGITLRECGCVPNFGKPAAFKRRIFDNESNGSFQWIQCKNPRFSV